ncbi:MAG: hypothetical protein PHW96_04080 [Candidatus Nanoarchaeia archaeon]|nr:hypothetical protein [Candidatus Nanoarchaeia archaeon]
MGIGIPTGLVVEEVPPLSSAIQILKDMGFFDVILPFLLIFAVTFGALQKTKLFGDKGTGINSIVAFSLAMMVTAATKMVGLITGFMEQLGIWVVFIVFFLMTATLVFGKDIKEIMEGKDKGSQLLKAIGIIVAIVGVTVAALIGTGILNTESPIGQDVSSTFSDIASYITPEDITLIVMLIVFGVIIALIVKKS